jgi:hypothetical protein
LAMVDLLKRDLSQPKPTWYAATEYSSSNSYFDNPQHFKKFNLFTKYQGKLSEQDILTLSASTFYSSWHASGQIPVRAVQEGIIGFYGAIDPNEGGTTSRTNLNALLVTSLPGGDFIKNQLYYSRYTFDLHSDFTFFLVDSINGDEIRQRESRDLAGYNGSYTHKTFIGACPLTSQAGVYTRLDATYNTELSHTKDRYTEINPIKLGDIREWSAGSYINEILQLSQSLSLHAGLRFDHFFYQYNNQYAKDSSFSGTGFYKDHNGIVSPKLSLYYQADPKTELYASLGKGFHSNDTRVVVASKGLQTLPAAYGADLGTVYKPAKNLLIQMAAWYLYLQKEYVYGGDGGTVDFSGRTRRYGVDLSARYQPLRAIFLDFDMNYAHGRAIDDPKGQNYIPLAPVFSSTGGITYSNQHGINASLRYRYLPARPANETNSLSCQSYFINDLVLNYSKQRFAVGLVVNNLLNTRWKETEFDTVTRLQNEKTPVDGLCFTAGTKLAAKIGVSYFFH